MYLLESDIEFLNDWLNQEEGIAFLIPNGHKKWIAEKTHNILDDLRNPSKFFLRLRSRSAEYSLWHVPSGPLPLIQPHKGGVTLKLKKEDWKYEQVITNPWEGWTEQVTGSNPNIPYFQRHPGIIHLTVIPTDAYTIYISHFGWIGNRYSVLGSEAHPATEQFWKRLRRMVKKVSTQVPRQNQSEWRNEIYAFPNALKEIKNGKACE